MRLSRRLSFKLIVSLTIIVLIVRGLYSAYAIRTERNRLLDTMIVGADQLSRSITGATWRAMLDDHRANVYEIMQGIAEKQGIDRITMYNREGEVMHTTRPMSGPMRVDRQSEVCRSCHLTAHPLHSLDVHARVRYAVSPEGKRTLHMVTPIPNEPACSQAPCHAHPEPIKVLGVLDVALSVEPIEHESRLYALQVAALTAIEVLVIAGFIVVFVRRFVSRPIQELIEGTRALGQMQLDHPVTIPHSSQELDELAASFNTMRERLKAAVEQINQFTQDLEAQVARRTEQLKAAHQKLLQADRLASLGQLSASVAHEINNPIAAVLNLSMLLQRILKDDGIPRGREAEFRKYLGQIVSETARVGRIVSDLLAFSRRSKPQRASADINKLIQNTVSLVDHKLKLSNAKVDLELKPDLPAVFCDASQIQQVVLNLVLNAAEALHGRENGRVVVRTRVAADGEAVELEVEDNGEGIAPENLGKIFDPFFTTKPEGKGVGLGLAVLYGIVKDHDGEVDVSSTVGKGTRFLVTLPRTPTETQAAHANDRAGVEQRP